MMRLLIVEARRAMARGVTRLLLATAVAGLAITTVWLFAVTTSADTIRADKAVAEQQTMRDLSISGAQGPPSARPSSRGGGRPNYYYGPEVFEYADLWEDNDGQGHLLMPASLLFFGGLIAGASLIGSEWQTGSFVVFLTWEPRRVRAFLAKVAVHAGLAFVIAFALLTLFDLALLPTAALKGSTDGLTGAWFQSLATAMLRMSAITAFAAALGSALAMIGRRTALALISVFLYLFIVESLLGVWQESLRPWLLSINVAVFMTGADLRGEDFTRSTGVAGLTLLAYTMVFVLLAAAAFRRRDFAAG